MAIFQLSNTFSIDGDATPETIYFNSQTLQTFYKNDEGEKVRLPSTFEARIVVPGYDDGRQYDVRYVPQSGRRTFMVETDRGTPLFDAALSDYERAIEQNVKEKAAEHDNSWWGQFWDLDWTESKESDYRAELRYYGVETQDHNQDGQNEFIQVNDGNTCGCTVGPVENIWFHFPLVPAPPTRA